MREDSHGCVESCAHYNDPTTGNPTYKKEGENTCVADCTDFGSPVTIINLDSTECIT